MWWLRGGSGRRVSNISSGLSVVWRLIVVHMLIGRAPFLKQSFTFFFTSIFSSGIFTGINLFFINFPKSSFISKIISKDTKKSNSICFKFTDFFVFKNIEDNYSLFNTLNNLNVSLITNSKNYTLFLSNYIKIPSK